MNIVIDHEGIDSSDATGVCVSAAAQFRADGVDSDRPTDQQSIWKNSDCFLL